MLHAVDNPSWSKWFDRFKNRALSYQDMDDIIDPVIKDTVRLFNHLSGVATVFSCQGHPYEQDRHGAVQLGPDKGYIMLVVNDDKTQYTLSKTLNIINAALWAAKEDSVMFDIELSLTSGMNDILMPSHHAYPSITIRTPLFTDVECRNLWWCEFHSKLEEVCQANI